MEVLESEIQRQFILLHYSCAMGQQRSCVESQVFFKNLTDCHDESTVLLSHNNSFAFEAVRVIGDVYFALFALRSL